MSLKKWVVREADKEKASAISEEFNIDPFVAFLLVSRGIDTSLAVSSFLSGSYESVSPYRFADMEEAAFVIGDAIDNGEKICIYGDYDCDGVTATALLLTFLQNEGANVFSYIPHRISEGYGMSMEAVDKIKAQGADLIVTVDNGINSVEEAEYIYSLGMKLVVTDHHQLGDSLPRAEAVVNPHRVENDLQFRDYCGAGVAFKLAEAMYDGDVSDLVEAFIDLVAIGTIGDVVPLMGENRAFVRAGLRKINNYPRPALEAFVNANGMKEYTAVDLAFQLCPKINALGRLGDASRAVDFLISNDLTDCEYKYEQLCLENVQRQEKEARIIADVDRQFSETPVLLADRVIVVAGKDYHQGIIGIVANQLCEKYGRPAFVISVNDNGLAVGSARSINGFNILEAIAACNSDLVRFGGHPQAAGITLEENNIPAFRKHINEYAYRNYEMMPQPQLDIDLKISPNYLTLELVENLSVLEPYGEANPQAVFGVYKMKLISVTALKEGRYVRLELEKKGKIYRVISFNTPYASFPYRAGDILNLAVKVSRNLYRERLEASVQAVDIRLADADDEKYFREKNDYELYRRLKKADPSLYPDRSCFTLLYRFLQSCGGSYRYSYEDLYFRLQKRLTYGQLMHALKAFVQAGLIEVNGEIRLLETQGKVKLEDTKVIKTLRERLHLG